MRLFGRGIHVVVAALVALCVLAGCTGDIGESADVLDVLPGNVADAGSGDASSGELPKVPLSPFGAQSHDVPKAIASGTAAQVSMLRVAINWDAVEATKGTYVWPAVTDETIQSAHAAGKELLVYVFGTPKWARDADHDNRCARIAEAAKDSFRAFVAKTVERYGSMAQRWEFWNEPDAAFSAVHPGFPNGSPFGCWGEPTELNYGGERYARFLKVFYDQVKATGKAVHRRDLTVLSGGLLLGCDANATGSCMDTGGGSTTQTFLKGVIAVERSFGTPIFDEVGFHSYAYRNAVGKDSQIYSVSSATKQYAPEGFGWGADGVFRGKVRYLRTLLATSIRPARALVMNEGGVIVWEADDVCKTKKVLVNGQLSTAEVTAADLAAYVETSSNDVWRLYTRTAQVGVVASIWYLLEPRVWKCSGLTTPGNTAMPLTAFNFLSQKLGAATHVEYKMEGVAEMHRYCRGSTELRTYFTLEASKTQSVVVPASAKVYDKFGVERRAASTLTAGFEPQLVEREVPGGCKP